jgi:gamma-glutamylputrescine oxidase
MAIQNPIDQVHNYLAKAEVRQLKKDAHADVVIIGGGMAGLSAAQRFHEKGCSVIVIEKNFCASGASGKSSGFITPDSEYPLHEFVDRYGKKKAQSLWEFVGEGVRAIGSTIERHGIACDYQKQDTLVMASSPKDFMLQIKPEHEIRLLCGYDSVLYDANELERAIGGKGYHGGVSYGKTFGINGYQYLQGLKKILQDLGVAVYEETPAIKLDPHLVTTPYGTIRAGKVVLCTDRFIPELHKLTYEIYPIQTFLMVSAPLTEREIAAIFPAGPMMVWDTALIYTYFRITGENRLMLGGSTLMGTYAGKAQHDNMHAFAKLQAYFKTRFPQVSPQFEYIWPGLIGVSKDIIPLAGRDAQDSSLYYVGAAAGLPWAAALGRYSADALIDGRSEFDEFFSPYRPFRFGHFSQALLGTRLTFALSHITSIHSF